MSRNLAVDADSLSRKRLTELLSQTSHRVIDASDGVGYLVIVNSAYPDLIIIDPVIPYRCR
ncbi:hypothetical protein ACXR0O_02725 [Verrucomicrobiota bacterium sgz303538]